MPVAVASDVVSRGVGTGDDVSSFDVVLLLDAV